MLETVALLGAVAACGLAAAVAHGLPVLAWLAAVAFSAWAWHKPKIREYQFTLLVFPGLLGLIATPGTLQARAWGAVLAMTGFWATWFALQGRSEDNRLGWWPAVLPALWQPSPLALVGVAGLAITSSRRWRAGLAPARGAVGVSRPASWVLVLVLVAVIGLAATRLPAPVPLQALELPNVPMFEWPSQPPALPSSPEPVSASSSTLNKLRSGTDVPPWSFLVIVVFAGLWAVWNFKRQPRLEWRAGKPNVRRRVSFDLMFPLAMATGALGWFLIQALRSGSRATIRMPNWQLPPVFAPILVGLGVIAFGWWLWRWGKRRHWGPLAVSDWRSLPTQARSLELPADRVRAAYARWLHHLHSLDLPRDQAETPFEFARRVDAHHPNLRDATHTLSGAYERVRYGGQPSEPDADAVESALEHWLTVAPPEESIVMPHLEHATT